ncbi:acyl-acyl carrier protein thioesterase TE3, chloroplastic-like [Salvia miltiorrhiza]|uniref:acyl-acyl carrier protein thioesterase TE3, chloroplastic-like n=1 Tax=Salvia miltiorrhiza TaxID=226208 RepID=UPI0025AC057A|nr:acyl-acyl carrier protein thioesterase TE3, chloroplastic-like [Salvia miltiorrhiza]
MMLHHPFTHITTTHTPLSFPAVVTAYQPPALWRRCRRLASDNIRGAKGMIGFHEMELQVREHELNRFGVVNNAVYANYCELGMYHISYMVGLNDDHIVLALSEASYKYIAPLRKKDKFLLKGRMYDYSATRMYFEYFILKLPNHEPILESKATGVVLDKNLRPVRIPPLIASRIHQF